MCRAREVIDMINIHILRYYIFIRDTVRDTIIYSSDPFFLIKHLIS